MDKKIIITGTKNIKELSKGNEKVKKNSDNTIIDKDIYENINKQLEILPILFSLDEVGENILSNDIEIIYKDIKKKLSSYYQQDKKHKIVQFNEDTKITFEECISLLLVSKLKCYYCKENVKLIYKYIRDNKQWTLERIDNKIGHIYSNCVIACLKCNIQRCIMNEKKFTFTKQLNIKKIQ